MVWSGPSTGVSIMDGKTEKSPRSQARCVRWRGEINQTCIDKAPLQVCIARLQYHRPKQNSFIERKNDTCDKPRMNEQVKAPFQVLCQDLWGLDEGRDEALGHETPFRD